MSGHGAVAGASDRVPVAGPAAPSPEIGASARVRSVEITPGTPFSDFITFSSCFAGRRRQRAACRHRPAVPMPWTVARIAGVNDNNPTSGEPPEPKARILSGVPHFPPVS
jgi:hypothetical protein